MCARPPLESRPENDPQKRTIIQSKLFVVSALTKTTLTCLWQATNQKTETQTRRNQYHCTRKHQKKIGKPTHTATIKASVTNITSSSDTHTYAKNRIHGPEQETVPTTRCTGTTAKRTAFTLTTCNTSWVDNVPAQIISALRSITKYHPNNVSHLNPRSFYPPAAEEVIQPIQ